MSLFFKLGVQGAIVIVMLIPCGGLVSYLTSSLHVYSKSKSELQEVTFYQFYYWQSFAAPLCTWKRIFFSKESASSSLILCQKCTARKYDSHNNCMLHFFSQIGSRKIVNTAVNAHIWSDILSAFSVCSGEVSNKSTNKFRVTSVNSTVCFPSFIPSTWRFLYIAMVSRASDSSQWFFFFLLRQMKQPCWV